jgi:hypothetical protein
MAVIRAVGILRPAVHRNTGSNVDGVTGGVERMLQAPCHDIIGGLPEIKGGLKSRLDEWQFVGGISHDALLNLRSYTKAL